MQEGKVLHNLFLDMHLRLLSKPAATLMLISYTYFTRISVFFEVDGSEEEISWY